MTGEQLWDKFNRDGEIEVTAKEFSKLQEHLLDWMAPGDSFQVERTITGYYVRLA